MYMGKRKKLKKFFVHSLGCPKNDTDSEYIVTNLEQGFDLEFVADPEKADFVIVNTCGFIKPAIEESIDIIKSYKLVGKKVIVTGCLLQRGGEKFVNKIEAPGIFLPDIVRFNEILSGKKFVKGSERSLIEKNIYSHSHFMPEHFRYIKIADGCNHRCSFCMIPSIKGRYHSKPLENIIAEVKSLPKSVKEIILIAQDTTKYGEDLYGKSMLIELLKRVDEIFDGWIRVMYLYPSKIIKKVVDLISSSEHIVPYLDIPFQHVSDRVLKDMKRGYRKKEIIDLLDYIRSSGKFAVRTTFIVGFPSEKKEDFRELLNFLESYRVERIGVFKYSREKGSHAFNLGNVNSKIKEKRMVELMNLFGRISNEINQEFIGENIKVLVDGRDNGEFFGRTIYDAPEIDNLVWLEGRYETGKFYNVRIVNAIDFELFGNRV